MFPDGSIPEIQHEEELALRNSYNPWVHRVILQSLLDNQIVVEIGSGNMTLDDPCIIRMDITLSPYVDLVADAHHMPFLPESVDYVFSLAVFEHLRNPFLAAESIYEILKDGGFVYHECNFVFAYHGYPHHYFNATLQGMEQVFAKFRPLKKGVATYQMPSFALDMVIGSYLRHSHAEEYEHGRQLTQILRQVIDQDLMQYDIYFSEGEALNVAAGTYFAGVKEEHENSTLIPQPIREIWLKDHALRRRFADLNQLTTVENLLVWAKGEGRRKHPEIGQFLDDLVRFNKRGSEAVWDRSYIQSLPVEEPAFGAIGFDARLTMSENSRIALERSPVRPPVAKSNRFLLRKGMQVIRDEGLLAFGRKAVRYLRSGRSIG